MARALASAGVALLLASCQSATQPGPRPGLETVTVALRHVPTGTAMIRYDAAARAASVRVVMVGLDPNPGRSHPIHIHSGQCGERGPVLYSMGSVEPNEKGAVDKTLQLSGVRIPIPGSAYIDVHAGPGVETASGARSIACGNIAGGTSEASATLGAIPASRGPGYEVSGTATLRLDRRDRTLSVTVEVAGLVPGSRHAVHVHTGQCESEGPVRYGLPDLVADAEGHATASRAFSAVTDIAYGAWYVAVHEGPSISPALPSPLPSSATGSSPASRHQHPGRLHPGCLRRPASPPDARDGADCYVPRSRPTASADGQPGSRGANPYPDPLSLGCTSASRRKPDAGWRVTGLA